MKVSIVSWSRGVSIADTLHSTNGRTAVECVVDSGSSDDALTTVAAAFAAEPGRDAVYADLCYLGQHPTRVVRYLRSASFERGRVTDGWTSSP